MLWSVLILEDDPMQSEIMQDLLTYPTPVAQVIACFSSSDPCFTWLDSAAAPPSIAGVLLDMRLGAESGYELLPRLRQHPTLAASQIIAVTANVLPADLRRAREAGIEHLIGKPIQAATFPQAVAQALQGRAIWMPH